MGLPHVLVRFYTNPDGRDTRRTALIVIGLLSVFYQLPTLFGVFGHRYLPELAGGGLADATVLLLPERMLPGLPGQLLGGLVTAGAFAAFLSTASGLTVSVAGVLSQDLLPRTTPARRADPAVPGERRSSSIAVPYLLSLAGARVSLAAMVGLAFALAACTFCPLLVLGIWWPRSHRRRRAGRAGRPGGCWPARRCSSRCCRPPRGGWPGALLAQPAAWIVPAHLRGDDRRLAGHPARGCPADVGRVLLRLHAPESMSADLPSLGRSAR